MSALIRRHSTNQRDVREVALSEVDLSWADEVLDLGCGFGFMAQAIAERLPPGARITGVDAHRINREPFESRVRQAGRRAKFVHMTIDKGLPWRDEAYDLVVSTYSLYFFPQILPEIARVLRPGGRFLAVTHCAQSVFSLFRLAQLTEACVPWLAIVVRFCTENGAERLGRFFGTVDRLDYQNSLRFEADEVDDLIHYLRFKLESFNTWSESEAALQRIDSGELRDRLVALDGAVVEKDDTVFWCAGRLWEEGLSHHDEWLESHRPSPEHWSL